MNNNGLLSHLLSIALLPGVVAGAIPYYLNFYLPEPKIYDDHIAFEFLGMVFGGIGLLLLFGCIFMFATYGKGTLAPWTPTRKLVVRGPYRYVRNPMILGVIFILVGEAFYFNSIPILIWAMLFFVINTIYFEFVEERRLERKFGESYLDYKDAVARWKPSLKPYKPARK